MFNTPALLLDDALKPATPLTNAFNYSYSYRITLFNNVLRGIMQCRLV